MRKRQPPKVEKAAIRCTVPRRKPGPKEWARVDIKEAGLPLLRQQRPCSKFYQEMGPSLPEVLQ